MGLSRHPRKRANRLGSILLALPLILGVVTRLEAQDKALRPSKYACPVTANLFPRQERSGNILKFVFPGNAEVTPPGKTKDSLPRVVRRISISIMTTNAEDVEIPFECRMAYYASPQKEWGVHSGSFIVKADGSPSCYLLGPSAGLPGNIPFIEFNLRIPLGIEVKEVRFSNVGVEYVSKNCPWPEMEKELKEAFDESLSSPRDESKAGRFLTLLEKALPEIDCVGKGGGISPAPAWTLADREVRFAWIRYLSEKMGEDNDLALRVFAGIYDRASGVMAEEMADLIWRVLHDRPHYILKNWDAIKNYRRTILESRWLHSPTSNLDMIWIYQDITLKEPEYKSACEEITSILSEKEPSPPQPASVDTVRQLVAEIDQYIEERINQYPDRILIARMNPLDQSMPRDSWHWKKIENMDEAADYFVGYLSYMHASVLMKDSKVAFVSIGVTCPLTLCQP